MNVDATWKFNKANVTGAEQPAFNDAAWASVNLPHTWNNLDGEDGPTTTPAYYRGIGWYRKHFTFPADTMTSKKIYLQFDASAYITDGILPEANRADALHIAIATVAKVDVLVRWNFKHIVNLHRIHGYNAVNLRRGFQMLEIRSPLEVLRDE